MENKNCMRRIFSALALWGWLGVVGVAAPAAADLPAAALGPPQLPLRRDLGEAKAQPDLGEAGPAVALEEQPITPEELNLVLKRIHTAANAKDLEGIRELLWDDAQLVPISKGQRMEFTTPEYMDILKDTCGQTTSYTYEYQKEDCQANGARTRCTGTVRETMVLVNGQFLTSSVKGEDVFEKRKGVVKIVYSKANTDEAVVGSRPSPNVPLEILQKQK